VYRRWNERIREFLHPARENERSQLMPPLLLLGLV
jgi:hypothetical protein